MKYIILPFLIFSLTGCIKKLPTNQELSKLPKKEKIMVVNDYINSYFYINDRYNYNKPEHWVGYKEFKKNLGGDCEDFAISKGEILLQNGFDKQDLYLSLGTTTPAGIFGNIFPSLINSTHHAVLLYRDRKNNKLFYLDNASDKIVNNSLAVAVSFKEYDLIPFDKVKREMVERNNQTMK